MDRIKKKNPSLVLTFRIKDTFCTQQRTHEHFLRSLLIKSNLMSLLNDKIAKSSLALAGEYHRLTGAHYSLLESCNSYL